MADFPFFLWVAVTSVTPNIKEKIWVMSTHKLRHRDTKVHFAIYHDREGPEGNLLQPTAFPLRKS